MPRKDQADEEHGISADQGETPNAAGLNLRILGAGEAGRPLVCIILLQLCEFRAALRRPEF